MGFGMGLIWSGRAYGHKKIPGANPARGWGPEMGPIPGRSPRPSIFFQLFSGPGLGQAVLTWSRPWNGTGEHNAPPASTTAATRGARGMVRKEEENRRQQERINQP
jgi:hypothetical protein